jgi:hypothetical protein
MNPPDRTLVYRVSRNKHVMGEFDIDRIVELLDAGEFFWTDLCWTEGMGGWEPLSSLRSEIAAAKAFPAFTTAAPAAVGRRRMASPKAPSPGATRPHVAGWSWIAAGVSLGALVGLLTAHLFPEVVQVDRPVDRIVEKIVEKPVEVVRIVEKRVEVPARLTEEQQLAIDFAKEREDAYKREVGYGSTSMIPVLGKKVKIFVTMDPVLKRIITAETIRARVEAAFRRNGFEPVDPKDHSVFCNTLIEAEIFRADQESTVQIAGVIRLKVSQYFVAEGSDIVKVARFDVRLYENALRWGSNYFHELPARFEEYAVQACNDLAKAGKLPIRK